MATLFKSIKVDTMMKNILSNIGATSIQVHEDNRTMSKYLTAVLPAGWSKEDVEVSYDLANSIPPK